MSHYFERPKFKSIIHYYLNQFCDMEGQLQNMGQESSNMMQQFPAALKKSLRLFIIEIIPTILVSDGHNFIEAIFTKESINDFRKNYSHVKFSNLRDKVIYVSKWQLQLDHADSMKQFNSFQNINIKLVIEQFKPLMHESLNTRLTHSATSIFRNPEIQTLVKNYRHWFAQTLVQKQALNQASSIALPSLNEVFGPNKAKRNSQNEYSQNTTQFSENDNGVTEDFGANIQKTQVFRLSQSELKSDLKLDSHNDFEEFEKQVRIKKSHVSGDLRLADIDRIVIQEKGEQFFAEKNFSKSRQWLEQVQDEHRREELKLQIEYFNVGNQVAKFDSHYETQWQREEREKSQKKFQNTGYRSKRIIGYTFGYTASSIKEKLIRMLDSTKGKSVDIQGYANKQISKAKSMSPTKGRPRSNSQENLLLMNNIEDSKSQMSQLQQEAPISREPLSQFVQHQMPIFHDDDTQSEQDSMENEIEQQLQRERNQQPQEDKVFDGMQPLGISMYKSYLEWFQQNDISHQSYIDVQLARDFEEEARQEQIARDKKEKDSKRFSFRLVEKNKPKEDVEMTTEEPQNQIIEQSPVKQESDTQLQLERSEEQEVEMKQESGKLSPIEQFMLPKEDVQMTKEEEYSPKEEILYPKQESQRYTHEKRQAKQESERSSPERNQVKQDSLRSESPQRNHAKQDSLRSESPQRNYAKQDSVRGSPQKSSYSKCSSNRNSSPVREDLLAASSPVKESPKVLSHKSSPILKEDIKATEVYETPVKPIIDINLGMEPPKPVHLMTTAEKKMWDLELEFFQMKQEMERRQREMEQLFFHKKQAAIALKEEEDRKERERLEQERLEKERIEKERLEKIRLEKERKEMERLEQERKERERIQMRKREQQELAQMRQEEKFMKQLIAEERKIEQQRILELQRQIQMEKERQLQEAIRLEKMRQEELRQIRMREDREKQERLAIQEKEKQEKERQQKIVEAQASQARITNEAMEAEKRRRMAMLQEERSRQQPVDDWQEGNQSNQSSSYDSDHVNELENQRQAYIQNMNKKFGSTLNQEIRRMETKDMTRRKIKKVENEDKLYDFVKIKNIKLEKMEQQRRQLENSSSSQPSKDSKESKKQPEDDDSSEKLSSSKSEADDLNQYDLFDNKNEEELPDIDDESIAEITKSQLESPSKVKQLDAYPDGDNDQIKKLSAQINMLKQQLEGAVNSIKILSSQSQLKDPKAQNQEEDEDDYHLPAFGSQVSPKKKANPVEPFNIGKRNFSQYEEEQQYRQYENEYKNSPTKQGQFKNLTEFVNHQKMELHKNAIKEQHVKREQYIRHKHMQQRMSQGPNQQQPQKSSQSTQGIHGRPRERSSSREQMRPPQPMVKQQPRPQGQAPMQQRQSQQQQQQMRGPSQQQGPPRGQGPVMRQRSGSPQKQPQQSPMGMNVAGNKRYMHSQNPGGQGYMKQKMQPTSQSYDPQAQGQTLKRRKIVIEDDDQ